MDQETIRHAVEHHYGRGAILNSIMQALRDMGKDVTQLAPADFAPGVQDSGVGDKSHQSLEWYRGVVETLQRSGPLPLGLHLLMGHTAKAKFENNIRNLQEGRIVVCQAVAEKA